MRLYGTCGPTAKFLDYKLRRGNNEIVAPTVPEAQRDTCEHPIFQHLLASPMMRINYIYIYLYVRGQRIHAPGLLIRAFRISIFDVQLRLCSQSRISGIKGGARNYECHYI